MNKHLLLGVFFLLSIPFIQAQTIQLSDRAGLKLQVNNDGTISSVELNGNTLPAGTMGGFYSKEPNSDLKVPLTGTATVLSVGKIQLNLTNSHNDSVTAVITEGEGFIEVSGELKDLTGTDRGLWLGFNLPVNTNGWKWGQTLSLSPFINSSSPGFSGDYRFLVPIPAVWNTNGGIALCIPPTNPCVFENGADVNGLRIQMAFGLSPITTKFPSKAPFRFRIYSCDGTWGFRDALAKYYDWYPDYYSIEPKVMKRLNHRRDWLTMNYENLAPSKTDMASIASPDLGEFCAYTKITARPQNMTGVDLTKNDINNSQGYIDAIANCIDILHYNMKGPVTYPSLIEARSAINNCVTYHPEGNWSMEMTPTVDALDIGHNVSPYLFKDEAHPNWPVFADMYLRRPSQLLKYESRFTHMHWDRLGGRSAIVNYRKEHFAYTQHPLTFDQLGRICLPTQFTNYELFDAFRLQAKQGGMYHEGAGMKDFGAKNKNEMLGGQDRVGLFFLSSVLASAWTEGGEKPHTLGEYDLFRIFMGRKSYRIACDDIPTMVAAGNSAEAFTTVKRALATTTAFGFANVIWDPYFYSPSHPKYNPATGSVFYSPEHQNLWDNYIPTSEAIRLAGWEPVTYAFSSSPLVALQRFGRGDTVYLTAWGPNTPASVDIEVDSVGLGLTSNSTFNEVISNTPITITKSEKGFKLTIPMEINMTRVIKITRNNLETSVKENFDNNNPLQIYPNPAKSIVNINSTYEIKCVEITDLSGKLQTSKLNSQNIIDVSSLQKGMYLLRVTTDNGIFVKKISKE